MIRLIYWSLALIELLLLLATLLLFIVTDARTIKYFAKNQLASSSLSYESIEGNLLKGLEVKELSYKNKPLFSSAHFHWNPLALLNHKIIITDVEAKGIEVENIIKMTKALKSDSSSGGINLGLDILIKKSHFDINSYSYEGVKFSSFVLDTGSIALSRALVVNTSSLKLKFDSDLANISLKGKIEESQLLLDELALKEISLKSITKLTKRLKKEHLNAKNKQKSERSSKVIVPLKKIKIKHILATLKGVDYGDFKIKGASMHLYGATIDPAKKFTYDVRKVNFKGATNFGKVDYKGYIEASSIYAKGEVTLDRELFKRYKLPLNFTGLEKLPSSLHINHQAVEVKIEHHLEKLLEIQSDFNIDIKEAEHYAVYEYKEGRLEVDSNISGRLSYAENFKLNNRLSLDKHGFRYDGEVALQELSNLPLVVSDYLVPSLDGRYHGTGDNFEMQLASELLTGTLSLPHYKEANLFLKSKSNNIALRQLIKDVPLEFQDEQLGLESQSFFDFKNLEASEINLAVDANMVDVNAKMTLQKPYTIDFSTFLKDERLLTNLVPNLNFNAFRALEGSVTFDDAYYTVNVNNEHLKLFMNYDVLNQSIEKGVIEIENEQFTFNKNENSGLSFQSTIPNIQAFFEKIKRFYAIEFPNIQGEVAIEVEQQRDGSFWVHLKSPQLQYLSEGGVELSVTNIYNIDTTFKINKALNQELNIEIENYQFNLDDNGYLDSFYSNRVSHLSIDEGLVSLKELWINEKIKITGGFNLDSLQGDFFLNSDAYSLTTKDFALIADLDLNVKINRDKFDIEGNIDILGDTITYEVAGSQIVEDSDIVIVEEMIKQQESLFNNFKLYLKIKSKKPLKYIAENINVEFLNQLSILKNYDQDMLVTGTTSITKGEYLLENKLFTLDESHLYFTGDIKKPLLDIKANYEKDEYNVHVFISGTTDAPIINFNSEPYLTQQEILSLILFDGTGSSSGRGAEAYTLLGGVFAKGLIKSLGIEVDHLFLGEDAQQQLSIEIGKKVSRNVSVLYLHRDGLSGVKVRVEHSNRFETDIIIQPPNTSSIEFLYKQDR